MAPRKRLSACRPTSKTRTPPTIRAAFRCSAALLYQVLWPAKSASSSIPKAFAPARPPCVVTALNAERLFSTRFSRDSRAAGSLWIATRIAGVDDERNYGPLGRDRPKGRGVRVGLPCREALSARSGKEHRISRSGDPCGRGGLGPARSHGLVRAGDRRALGYRVRPGKRSIIRGADARRRGRDTRVSSASLTPACTHSCPRSERAQQTEGLAGTEH